MTEGLLKKLMRALQWSWKVFIVVSADLPKQEEKKKRREKRVNK